MIFYRAAADPDLSSFPLSYLAAGTGRFVSRSSFDDPDAYQVTAESMFVVHDHYGYANGDVRLYAGADCLLCPAAYRGDDFRGEDTTPAFSTYLIDGAGQEAWNNRNNQILYYVDSGSFAAVGMRFESSYAVSRFDESILSPDNPVDYLIREAVHVRPGTLVVRDLHRRRLAGTTLDALWHLGSSAAVTTVSDHVIQLDGLSVSSFGDHPPTAAFGSDTDASGARIGTLMTDSFPATTDPVETVWVFSETVTGVSYADGVLTLSDGTCVSFVSGPAVVAACE